MNRIPGLSLRTTINRETEGIDYDQFEESTYGYIELRRDFYATLNLKSSSTNELLTQRLVDSVRNTQQRSDKKLTDRQNELNSVWWNLRIQYNGIMAHIPRNEEILQFQGITARLCLCDVYGNRYVGEKFKEMLTMGNSKSGKMF
ncbi:unnamed protein product [Rotaria socialis]|uniref:Uncharacterized protein n=1 Tax=Rotaria socialis TaxID=392032 RepID=A0A818BVV0_9BILA|nr:unnamed protein product [Rotaria socialis]